MLFYLCSDETFHFNTWKFSFQSLNGLSFWFIYNFKLKTKHDACEISTYLLMLWCPFNLLQSNKRTVPSVLPLAKSDELELSAVSFVTDDLCSCKCAINVPFILWPGGMSEARFIAAFESLLAFSITYWVFNLLCNKWSSFRQSEFRSDLSK